MDAFTHNIYKFAGKHGTKLIQPSVTAANSSL